MTIKLINIKAIKPLSCTCSNCMPRIISSGPCATAQSVAITIFTVYTFIAYVSIDINDKLFMTNLAKIHQFNICKYGKIYKNSDCSNGYSRNDIHIDFVEISQYFYAFWSIIIFLCKLNIFICFRIFSFFIGKLPESPVLYIKKPYSSLWNIFKSCHTAYFYSTSTDEALAL